MIDVNEAMKTAAAKVVIDIAMDVLYPPPEVTEAAAMWSTTRDNFIPHTASAVLLADYYLSLTALAAPEKGVGRVN